MCSDAPAKCSVIAGTVRPRQKSQLNNFLYIYLNFRKVELYSYTRDAEYLRLVRKHVKEALEEFSPQLIVYNAGTDVLEGDPLGALSISPQVKCFVILERLGAKTQ